MIAIAGIVWRAGQPPGPARLTALAAPLGLCDDAAVTAWNAEGVALACSGERDGLAPALAIDDASGRAVVFDGRLDNRDELADQLAGTPILSTTGSDAAVVLAAHLRWGDEAIARLVGDFALALWDGETRELLLARDPMGMRPLHYSLAGGRFVFASTLEQLLRLADLPRELDEAALVWHLYGPNTNPGGESQPLAGLTCYRCVRVVQRGHHARATPAGVRPRRYWSLPDEPPEPDRRPRAALAEELRALLTEAVRCRLRGRGRAGLLLSGGLDSGAIACIAGRLAPGVAALHAYTNAYDRLAGCDERGYAAACTGGLAGHTLLTADDRSSLSSFMPGPGFVEPFFTPYDDALAPLFARARADGARVMLTGNGGDHLLTGSPAYLADWLLAGCWRALAREVAARGAGRRFGRARTLLRDAVLPLAPRAVQRLVWPHNAGPAHSWLPQRLRERHHPSLPSRPVSGRRVWWEVLRSPFDLRRQIYSGSYSDRLARRFGMELAQPFFDARLVRFVVGLPPEALFYSGKPKALLRESLHDLLPPRVRDRTDKADVSPLLREGLQRRRRFLQALLADSELERRELVRPREWRAAMSAYLDGASPPYWDCWRSLTLELWLRDREGRLPAP